MSPALKATRQYTVLELHTYIVNAKIPDAKEDAWAEVGIYAAHDDDAAVRYHIAETGAESGTYRAVVRSAWEPLIRIKVIKTTKLTLEHGEPAKRRKPSNQVAKPEAGALTTDRPGPSDPDFFDPAADLASAAALFEGAPA